MKGHNGHARLGFHDFELAMLDEIRSLETPGLRESEKQSQKKLESIKESWRDAVYDDVDK